MSENNLNPEIRRVKIGKRTLREVEVLPLSYADEKRIRSEVLPGVVSAITKFKDKADHTVIEEFVDLVFDNIDLFIELAIPSDDPQTILNDLTNSQLADIVDIIIDVNFKSLAKKVGNLLGTLNKVPLPQTSEKVEKPKKKLSKKS